MTVADLIEHLKSLPLDSVVCSPRFGGKGFSEINSVDDGYTLTRGVKRMLWPITSRDANSDFVACVVIT